MPLPCNLRRMLAPCLLLFFAAAEAQTPPTPAAAASAPARAASAPAQPSQRIEITGGRESDTEQRRQSTAAKIVIGREEIDKYGDATVGEVLRRLPGVTTPGAPGRGGPPRMRGLGGGFTQLLIDGQRIPPGFSLESLTPEQVERIEILRAPTAETGARAIAGTINIITREGYRRRLNDLRIGFGVENGQVSPGVNWTHNDSAGDLTYNISGSVFRPHRRSSSDTRTTVTRISDGELLEERHVAGTTTENRTGANLTSRLQWRLGEAGSGDLLALTPSIFHTESHSDGRFQLVQNLSRPCAPGQVEGCTPDLYDHGDSTTDSRFTNGRLGAQWRRRVGDVRVELNGGGGLWRAVNNSLRNEFGAPGGPLSYDERSSSRENSLNLNLKGSGITAGGNSAGAEHNLVGGLEVDASQRRETKVSLQNGQAQLTDFENNLQASALRLAAFAQDEWAISPNWSAHAGLRWEGITTRGDSGNGERPTNRSSVWTPLLHAVWKPDPKSRDQVRMSLTRSYRSPQLGTLIARPSINRLYPVTPVDQPNTELNPDSAGNPRLQPELATGIDIALERYLEGGGVLSANVFHRNISNLMRGRVAQEDVSWSSFPRWVRRQQNIGDATTSGLELEAKFRLDQLVTGATPVELRSNLSMYTSKVKSVPGPDNRLDEQAKATANLGADYRLRGLPLTLGGNVNWVPGYTTRIDDDQTRAVTTKQVWDAYALWTFNPAVALRVLGSNLVTRDYATTTTTATDTVVAGAGERSTTRSSQPSYINWQLRLELKL
jgi:iron complex outermembrane receptor protein